MPIDYQRVSQRIALIMQQMHFTQKQLADMLQVTQPAISKYLQGRIPPPPVLLRLSEMSGRSMEWFLTGEMHSIVPNKISESQTEYGRQALLTDRIDRLPPILRQKLSELVDSMLLELPTG
jgi:transcriptional regulator with XRE-family HTH domain